MKLCVLIIAHKNVDQLNRLIECLIHQDITIFVHIDKKSLINIEKINTNAILIENRINVKWGRFSQVEATLVSINYILNYTHEFDYLGLISAQDYPIISNDQIISFLNINKGKEFIEHSLLGEQGWKGAEARYQYFYFDDPYISKIIRILMKALRLRRKFIDNYIPYGGSQWWCLSKNCVEYIDRFVRENKKFVKFYQTTDVADEMFFQTIILNSNFKTNVINNNYRYIDWSEHKKNPKLLTAENYNCVIKSDKHFARKLDTEIDLCLFDLLDSNRRNTRDLMN